MKIKIAVTNKEKGTNETIWNALKEANGKATQHTLTSSKIIIKLAEVFENELYKIIGKKSEMSGAIVTHRSGGKLPNAYKNSRIVTKIEMRRGSDCWWLTDIKTSTAWNDAGKSILKLTNKQDAVAVANFRTQYQIINEV